MNVKLVLTFYSSPPFFRQMKVISALILGFALVIAVSAQQAQKLAVGGQAPAFSAASLSGSQFSLDGLQGKVVLITFWSTTCQICHSEIPKLNRVASAYAGRDVVFLAVTPDNAGRIGPYLKKNPFNFTIVPDAFGMTMDYADKDNSGRFNMVFPAYYLIDQKGRIAMRGSGWDKTEALNSGIGKLLGGGRAD